MYPGGGARPAAASPHRRDLRRRRLANCMLIDTGSVPAPGRPALPAGRREGALGALAGRGKSCAPAGWASGRASGREGGLWSAAASFAASQPRHEQRCCLHNLVSGSGRRAAPARIQRPVTTRTLPQSRCARRAAASRFQMRLPRASTARQTTRATSRAAFRQQMGERMLNGARRDIATKGQARGAARAWGREVSEGGATEAY